MTVGQWGICGNDDGIFNGDWPTKAEAIAAAPEELELKPGDSFRVGQYAEFEPREIDADSIFDEMGCDAEDRVGEASECWLANVPKEQADILTERLTKVFRDWMKETGNEPEFLSVVDVEECIVPEAVSQ